MSSMTTWTAGRRPGGALIASGSSAFRGQVLESLQGRWWPVEHAGGGAEALEKLAAGPWQILFLDRRLPDLDSEELIATVLRRFPGVEVVRLDSAAEFFEYGLRKDANDLRNGMGKLEKDEHQLPQIKSQEESSWEKSQDKNNKNKQDKNKNEYEPLPGMIGRSEAMQGVYRLAQLVAPRTTTVLITGPTGSGKELVARALHLLSPRAAKAFVAVNCAAIPEALLESELFGYARGAFTGAVQTQLGRIAGAHGGTLFLDEVSELPLAMQAKLLRFLEQKEVQRLGTVEAIRVDVRVIAASNVDLAGRASRGEFREDLFYRLSAFPLELPPLSERRADIIPLAEHFLACMAAARNEPCPHLGDDAARILEGHPWKGNVRELQHVMERASILIQRADTVLSEHLYFPFQQTLLRSTSRPLSCASRAS